MNRYLLRHSIPFKHSVKKFKFQKMSMKICILSHFFCKQIVKIHSLRNVVCLSNREPRFTFKTEKSIVNLISIYILLFCMQPKT